MPWKADQLNPVRALRYVRSDGAVVKYSMGPSKRTWIAYEPDPSEAYIATSRSGRGATWPRRWASAEAAMRAVDKLYPDPQSAGENT